MSFLETEAAIAAGATLDELYKWRSGGYSRSFKAYIVAWFNKHKEVEIHTSDVLDKHAKSKAKRSK